MGNGLHRPSHLTTTLGIPRVRNIVDSRLQSFAEYMVSDWNGRDASRIGGFALNFDGRYGNQCMDLFNWVWTELGVPSEKITRTVDAAGVWELGKGEGIWEYFDRVAPDQPFQPADIFVFNRNAFGAQGRGAGNGYGHIGMVVRDLGNGSFEVLEANGLGDGYEDEYMNQYGSPARLHVWTRKDLYGVLRPKPEKCSGLNQFTKQETSMGKVAPPIFVQRPAHPNNYTKGRPLGRDGRYTFHHVVGSAESAAITFANGARQASATFTVTNTPGVVFQHLSIDDSPWSDGNADSNMKTISSEHHGDWRFGYRDETVIANAAQLVAWLRDNNLISHHYRHWQVSQIGTACCCDLPVEEIWNRATDIINAAYNGTPVPQSPGTGASIQWKKYDTPKRYRLNKDANLWRFDAQGWDGFNATKVLDKGSEFVAYGEGYNPAVDATYLVTEFSFTGKIPNGVNVADLDLIEAPKTVIRWEDIPNVEYVFIRDANLVDFNRPTHAEMPTHKVFKKGDRITISAKGINDTVKSTYLVTEYSYSTKSTIGANQADLEVYVPPAPPAPAKPEWEVNLKDISAQKLTVLTGQTPLINLVTGETVKQIGQGTVVDVLKSTVVGGVEYLISSYSAKLHVGQGMRRADLGVPNTPPANEKPKWLEKWEDIADVDMYVRADTHLFNLEDSSTVKVLNRGEKIRVASTAEVFGQKYALTEYSTKLMQGRGVRLDDLDMKPITDGPITPAPTQPSLEGDVSWIKDVLGKVADKLGVQR